MSDLEKQREQIIIRLKEVNDQLTEEMIENATKEEMEQYIELIDSITAKLVTIDRILEENK